MPRRNRAARPHPATNARVIRPLKPGQTRCPICLAVTGADEQNKPRHNRECPERGM